MALVCKFGNATYGNGVAETFRSTVGLPTPPPMKAYGKKLPIAYPARNRAEPKSVDRIVALDVAVIAGIAPNAEYPVEVVDALRPLWR